MAAAVRDEARCGVARAFFCSFAAVSVATACVGRLRCAACTRRGDARGCVGPNSRQNCTARKGVLLVDALRWTRALTRSRGCRSCPSRRGRAWTSAASRWPAASRQRQPRSLLSLWRLRRTPVVTQTLRRPARRRRRRSAEASAGPWPRRCSLLRARPLASPAAFLRRPSIPRSRGALARSAASTRRTHSFAQGAAALATPKAAPARGVSPRTLLLCHAPTF